MRIKGVKDNDAAYRQVLRELEKLASKKLHVGVLGSSGDRNLEVGAYHEFGTRRIPKRSFIRDYYDEKQDVINEATDRIIDSVAGGKNTADQALDKLGTAIVGGIQKRISDRIEPALKGSTVARKGRIEPALDQTTIDRKGSDVPLIDTGQLRSSIKHEVR